MKAINLQREWRSGLRLALINSFAVLCCGAANAAVTGGCLESTVGSDTLITCTSNGSFTPPIGVTGVRYLIVGGGGGGGGLTNANNLGGGGGGGAGGVRNGTSFAVTPSTAYAITVGAGGAGGVGGSTPGGTGGSSAFSSLTATGGGGGASYNTGSNDGVSGASGGGGRISGVGGSGTVSQGNDGGDGNSSGGSGGGGGAGSVGSNGSGTTGGTGGTGISDNITGSSLTYGRGGTGGSYGSRANGASGSANTGNGGEGADGSANGSAVTGGAGGSGIVILRYSTPSTTVGNCSSGTVAGVINTYYPVTTSLAAGVTSITVGTATGASTSVAANDLVLIMQMQNATIDTTNTSSYGAATAVNAGKYEYAVVASVAGSTVTLASGLINSYTYQAGSNAVAQKSIQLIRVPAYSSASLGAGVTAAAWNGATGGVLAFDVTGALNLNSATVDVSGKGFRGGGGRQLGGGSGTNADYRTLATNNANGSKGEGMAGTPRYVNNVGSLLDAGVDGYPNGSYAKGAPGNAAGGGTDDNPPANDENTGGGGGAGRGNGGYGGYGWNATTSPGRGIGGTGVVSTASQLVMGGGGGAGTTNNGTGTPGSGFASSGEAGGGLIMVRAGSMTGSGTFNVSGSNANNTVTNDGSGGGGGGGAVLAYAGSGLTGLSVVANGGTGGTNTGGGSDHGPGGGGGGGYVLTSGVVASCAVNGGSSGTTYASHTFGATAGSAGACATSLTSGQIVGAALGQGPCASAGFNHLRIEHSGSGVTCAPTTLTIKACTDTLCTSLYAGGVTGTLTETGTPTVNWVGGAAFAIGATGLVTKDVQVTTAGSVTWGASGVAPVASNGTTCYVGATNSCSFTSNLAGFLFDVPHHASDTAQTISVNAVKQADNSLACTPAFASTSKTINFGCAYSNPATGTLPVVVGGNNITCGSTSGIALNFNASGVASTTVRYADVGQMSLTASYTGSSGSEAGLVMTGSDTFIAVPASLLVTPAGPYVAGNNFSVTVAAKNASGNTTPNFGKESTTENVMLTHTLTGPAGGNNPTLTGTTTLLDATFQSGNGVAATNSIAWGEVGDINITATLASGSYLGSGLTATGSAAAGAFKPAYFDTVVTPGTGSFTYSGQPFTVQVSAKNASGGTALNYQGAYARAVTLSDGNSGTNNSATLGTFSNAGIAAASFNNGVATTNTVSYRFNTKTTAPLEAPGSAPLKLRALDTDSVTSSGHTEGTTPIRAGRLRLVNFYGSELLKPRVEYRAEYWDGNRWATNTLDSSNPIVAGNIATGSLTVNGIMALNNGIGFITFNTAAAGSYDIALDLNASGVDTSCNAAHGGTAANKPWLQGYWSAPANCGGVAAWVQDPNARIRLGSPRAPYIYLRERY